MEKENQPGKATVREIAKACGVSRTAVSWALSGKPGVSEKTRQRILDAAVACGYTVDPKVSQVMSGIAGGKTGKPLTQIALVSAKEVNAPPPYKENFLLNRFYLGFERRVNQLGIGLNAFWLAQKGMNDRRMVDILKARGIDGVVFLFEYGSALKEFNFDISQFSVSSICQFLKAPKIDAADVDNHNCMFVVMEKVRQYGYKRPGLVVKETAVERSNHAWESAFLYKQMKLDELESIPVFWSKGEEMAGLAQWYKRYKPDVIIGHEPPTLGALRNLGIPVPDEVGFIALEQHNPKWNLACIDVHPGMIASAAVDLVLERVRDGVKGAPVQPKTVLIDGHWVDGITLPDRRHSRSM